MAYVGDDLLENSATIRQYIDDTSDLTKYMYKDSAKFLESIEAADDIAFGLTRAERIHMVRKRPPRYRTGVVNDVWEAAKKKSPDGKVRDPNTGEELFWDKTKNRDGQWEMGHKPEQSYDQLKQRFIDGEISRKQFLDEYNNPANYRPEARSPNRSRKYD